MHLALLHPAAPAPGALPVCIFEASVLTPGSLLLHSGCPPLQLPARETLVAELDGARATVALQYVSVALGVLPQCARRRLTCDYGVAVVRAARAPHVQYPDAMGLWETLAPDEAGGSVYTVHFRVAVYLSLAAEPGVAAKGLLHLRLNINPVCSKAHAASEVEEKREVDIFELRQAKYNVNIERKNSNSKAHLIQKAREMECQMQVSDVEAALRAAKRKQQSRAQRARNHNLLQGGLVCLGNPQWVVNNAGAAMQARACRAVLLCLAYCPPLVDYCDRFVAERNVPLSEEIVDNRHRIRELLLSVCKSDSSWAVARFVGLARPRNPRNELPPVVKAAWIFTPSSPLPNQSDPTVPFSDKVLYASEASLLQRLLHAPTPAQPLLSGVVFDRLVGKSDAPDVLREKDARMRALFQTRTMPREPGLAELHASLQTGAPERDAPDILAVHGSVPFERMHGELPALAYAGASYELCAAVLQSATVLSRGNDAASHVACVRLARKGGGTQWHTQNPTRDEWQELAPAEPGAAARMRIATLLLYWNVLAGAASDTGDIGPWAPAQAVPAGYADLPDASAQRLASAFALCLAFAPPFAGYCCRSFADPKDPRAVEHMRSFAATADIVKWVCGSALAPPDAAALAPPDAAAGADAYWAWLRARLVRSRGLCDVLQYIVRGDKCSQCVARTPKEWQTGLACEHCGAVCSRPPVQVVVAPDGGTQSLALDNSALGPLPDGCKPYTLTGALFAPAQAAAPFQAWVAARGAAPQLWLPPDGTAAVSLAALQSSTASLRCVALVFAQLTPHLPRPAGR